MIREQVSLKPFNTLSLPATASRFVSAETEAQLLDAIKGIPASDVQIIGEGSNLVVGGELKKLVVRLQFNAIALKEETSDSVLLEVEAGANWDQLVCHCVENGWYGLENLSLIPGTVGAAPYQNIGAYGVELADVVDSVTAINLNTKQFQIFELDECCFSYRDSRFKSVEPGLWLIVRVNFRLSKHFEPTLSYADLEKRFLSLDTDQQTAATLRNMIIDIRQSKLPDPAQLPNAGSFFKNPIISHDQFEKLQHQFPDVVAYTAPKNCHKLAAGWLIEQAGWKGKRLGPVGMHAQQALVLVNYDNANSDDVYALQQAVTKDVADKFGVELEREPVWLAD